MSGGSLPTKGREYSGTRDSKLKIVFEVIDEAVKGSGFIEVVLQARRNMLVLGILGRLIEKDWIRVVDSRGRSMTASEFSRLRTSHSQRYLLVELLEPFKTCWLDIIRSSIGNRTSLRFPRFLADAYVSLKVFTPEE